MSIINPKYIYWCLLLMFLNFAGGAWRWKILLKSQDIDMSFLMALKMTLVGNFFNFVAPGGIGGDVVKGYYVSKDNHKKKLAAITTVVADRIVGLYSMLLMAIITMLFDYRYTQNSQVIMNIFIFSCLIFIGMNIFIFFSFSFGTHDFFKKGVIKIPWGHRIVQICDIIAHYSQNKKTLFRTLILSFFSQTFIVILFYVIGISISPITIPISSYFVVVTIGQVVTAIPISPAGIGVGQATFYFLFNLYTGRVTDIGSNIITVAQILSFLFGVVGAIFYVLKKEKINSKETLTSV